MTFERRFYDGIRAIVVILAVATMSTTAWAQGKFPSRPIDVVIPWPPGGGIDQFTRAVAPLLARELGVKMNISHVTGSVGNVGLKAIAKAKPNGYTIGPITAFTISSWVGGQGSVRTDDLHWIGLGQIVNSMLFVPANSPFKMFKDVLDYAKKNPNKLKLAMGGFGGPDDLTRMYLAKKGYKLRGIPYDKPSERYAAPIGGHVELLYEEPGDVRQFLDAKQIRPLVVFAGEKDPYFSKLPIMPEFGFDVYFGNWRTFVTASGVSMDRAKILNKALTKVFKTPEYKKFCNRKYSCTRTWSIKGARNYVKGYYETLVSASKEFVPKKKKK